MSSPPSKEAEKVSDLIKDKGREFVWDWLGRPLLVTGAVLAAFLFISRKKEDYDDEE